jgi:K+-transporting ATPase c subunit
VATSSTTANSTTLTDVTRVLGMPRVNVLRLSLALDALD